ncbi:hypothetical protein M407DRAFT_28479 [Tulasnella calospora MUT 4182]|uniref:Uncharacterized protein n=1 Tax=Tulasnella calospora MUT 4182 TaxID=1051891 RepID=A0A0C3KKK0_9AGAM|nr:hypothetical protein M407DRAFT_28479 [Tulasnella calospora MUT 4182]
MDELISPEDPRTSSKPSLPCETDGDMTMLEGGVAFAISELHSCVLEFGLPSGLEALLKAQAEIYNSATYSSQRNPSFSGLQLNVTGPTKGTFCNLEVMSSASKLRLGIHGGFFPLLKFGFFIKLKYGVNIAFSGLHQHGGTAPIVPPNMDFDPTDIRVTVISYPTRTIL